MARNKYKGTCYRCHKEVLPQQGHFERHKGGWRVQHVQCAIDHRVETGKEVSGDAEGV